MIKKLYSIKDTKAEAFIQPFMDSTDGLAMRAIKQTFKESNHPMTEFSEDFQLWSIGEIDLATGRLITETAEGVSYPQHVIDVKSLKESIDV